VSVEDIERAQRQGTRRRHEFPLVEYGFPRRPGFAAVFSENVEQVILFKKPQLLIIIELDLMEPEDRMRLGGTVRPGGGDDRGHRCTPSLAERVYAALEVSHGVDDVESSRHETASRRYHQRDRLARIGAVHVTLPRFNGIGHLVVDRAIKADNALLTVRRGRPALGPSFMSGAPPIAGIERGTDCGRA
jgi:hypothetical protein